MSSQTTVFDQEKSIDRSYNDVFERAHMFPEFLHVCQNMNSKLGSIKVVDLYLYDKALYDSLQ